MRRRWSRRKNVVSLISVLVEDLRQDLAAVDLLVGLYLPVQHEVEGVLPLVLTHLEEDLTQPRVLVLGAVVVYLDLVEDEVGIKHVDITVAGTVVGHLLDLFTPTVLIQGLRVVVGGEEGILEVEVIPIVEGLIDRIPLEVVVDGIPHLVDHIPVIAPDLHLPLFAEELFLIVGFLVMLLLLLQE